jgi:biotin carboxyl carrier protein
MKKQVRAGDTVYSATLSRTEDRVQAEINGKKLDVQLRSLPSGEIALLHEGQWHKILVAQGEKGSVWVGHAGQSVQLLPEESRRRREDSTASLSSPMPGKVIRVLVSDGEQVEKGQILLVVEAMKMELPIRAPRASMVRTVRCSAGERVASGVSLVELA